jgi:uncharacterized membrane protein
MYLPRKGVHLALLGFLLVLTGVIMNIQVLRRPYPLIPDADKGSREDRTRRLTPAEVMRSPPWLVSIGLTLAGIVLILLAR